MVNKTPSSEDALSKKQVHIQPGIKAVCDQLHEGVALLTPEKRVLFINGSAAQMLGAANAGFVGKAFPVRFKLGANQQVEYTLPNKSRSKIRLSLASVKMVMNGMDVIVVTLHPASESGEIEKELEESQRTFESMSSNIPGFIFRCRNDAHWTMERLSEKFEEISGYPAAELVNNSVRTYKSLVHPGDREFDLPAIQAALHERRPYQVIYRIKTRSGEVRWLWEQGRGVYDGVGKLDAIEGFVTDITQSKEDEAARAESEILFRTVFDHSGIGIALMDTDQKIIRSNATLQNMLGYSAEELQQLTISEITYPEDMAVEETRLRESLRGSAEGLYKADKRYVRKDGQVVWGRLTASLVRSPEGKPQFGIGMVEDISRQKLIDRIEKSIYEISQAAHAMGTLKNLYAQIHTILGDLMPVENFYISLVDENRGEIYFPYFIDQFDETPPPEKSHRTLTDYVLRTGRSLLASPEVFHDLVMQGEVESVGAPSIDWLGVPLRIGEKIIGVMVVQSYTEGVRFSYRDVQILEFVSNQIAMAIERKQAEDAFRAETEKYRTLFESSRDAIFLETLSGAIIDCNDTAVKMYGYTRQELLRLSVTDLIPSDNSVKLKDLMRRVMEQGSYQMEHLNIRRGGIAFPVEVNAVMTMIGDSRMVVVFVRDITERRLAEQALRESEAKFRALAETTSAMIMIHRGEEYLYVNPAFCAMSGYPSEQLLRTPFYDLTPIDERKRNRDKARKRLRGQAVENRYEYRIVTRSGAIRILDVTSGLIEYGGGPATMITALDITDRKGFEENLRLQSAALQSAANAIVITDAKGRITWVNPAFTTLTGYSLDEVMTRDMSILHSGELAPDYFDRMWQTIRSRKEWNGEVVDRRKNGTFFTADLTVTPVTNEKHEITHFVGIQQDITERKQHHRELEAIVKLSEALRTQSERAGILPVILEQVGNLMGAEGVSLSWKDEITDELIIQAASGIWQKLTGSRLSEGNGIGWVTMKTGKPYINNNAREDKITAFPDQLEGIEALVSSPLFIRGQARGALVVGLQRQVDENDVRVLSAISDITASAFHRAELFEQTRQQARDLVQAYDATIEGWARALELRDKETQGHTQRVTALTLRLCQKLGLPGNQLEHIRRGVLLHDIGKMGIPDSILLKEGTLTDQEREIMRLHPGYARELLVRVPYLKNALDIPYGHHEHWDGSGYPQRLKGEEIPFPARIFSVIDVWDALTSTRPYRDAWPREKALVYIKEQSGKEFDPRVVNAFFELVGSNEI